MEYAVSLTTPEIAKKLQFWYASLTVCIQDKMLSDEV